MDHRMQGKKEKNFVRALRWQQQLEPAWTQAPRPPVLLMRAHVASPRGGTLTKPLGHVPVMYIAFDGLGFAFQVIG